VSDVQEALVVDSVFMGNARNIQLGLAGCEVLARVHSSHRVDGPGGRLRFGWRATDAAVFPAP
jgi:hypothetical protein